MNQPVTDLYFEAHVTIDPVDEQEDEELATIAARSDFRVAELLMKKTLERSRVDGFMTGRGTDYEDLKTRTEVLVDDLLQHGFVVRRWKLENTLLDTKPYWTPN